MKSIAALALMSFLAPLAGCARTAASRSAREVSVLAPDLRENAMTATIAPPPEETEMQLDAPVKKERAGHEVLTGGATPETIAKPSIAAEKRIVAE